MIHFYLTFNPSKNSYSDPEYTQAHEFYDYLKKKVQENLHSYAYWGKIISKDRLKSINIEHMKKVIETNKNEGHSTHLFISDFKNLWVGKVEEVKENIGNDFQTLNFYKDKNVEVWFKISDFTLIEGTYEGTAKRLSHFFIDNEFMNLKIDELSPFTSGISYPAYIQDLSSEMYFDEKEGGPLILEHSELLMNSGLGRVAKILQTYAFPEEMYNLIPHSARIEIEAAELDLLESRTHNYAKVAFSYIKALEIIVNQLVIGHMKKNNCGDEFYVKPDVMPPKLYLNPSDDVGLIPIGRFNKNYSMNQLIFFVQRIVKANRINFTRAFKDHKKFIDFLCNDFGKILEENRIMDIRGVLAHSDSQSISVKETLAVRNLILGVGCKGLIHEVYQSFNENLKDIYRVKPKESSPDKKKNHLKVA
jgi:hypothetical protein